MKMFQQLEATCSCAVCSPGCLCGDCSACSNLELDRAIVGNAKKLSALAFVFVVLGSFVFFVPVVSLASTPRITETFYLRVQAAENATTMGSISFCLFGEGAVLAQGSYYPTVTANQTAKQACVSS